MGKVCKRKKNIGITLVMYDLHDGPKEMACTFHTKVA